jgi:hypothetical protein
MQVLLRGFPCSEFSHKVYFPTVALGSLDQPNILTSIILAQDSNWRPLFDLSKQQFTHVKYDSTFGFQEFALLESDASSTKMCQVGLLIVT